MSNNYTFFSEVLQLRDDDDIAWVKLFMALDYEDCVNKELWRKQRGVEEGEDEANWPSFSWKIATHQLGEPLLWMYSEEFFTPDHVIAFVQTYLQQRNPRGVFTMTYACTCSKPVVGEFGGGWFAISANEYKCGHTHDAANEALKILEARIAMTLQAELSLHQG
jgi:hypothetical protein